MTADEFLDRRGRRGQLLALTLLARRGPMTAEEVAQAVEGGPAARTLRRWRLRGWLNVTYTVRGPAYALNGCGLRRARWIAERARTLA